MKKKVIVIAALALMVAAPVFADDGSQQSGNWMNDMFKFCQQTMQQLGNGSSQSQNMPMNNGGMMGNGGMMMGQGMQGTNK